MLFSTVRLLLAIILFFIFSLIIKKSRVVNKRKLNIISLIIISVFATVSIFVPFENAFVTFSSPESAYLYNNPGKPSLVVEGKDTDLVVGKNNDTNVISLIPKSEKGWKIGLATDSCIVSERLYPWGSIEVHQYKDFDDYYIVIMTSLMIITNIEDNYGSQFYSTFNQNGGSDGCYYAHLSRFDNNYEITINDTKIRF